MNNPFGMGQIDFNDPYGYGMGEVAASVAASNPTDPIAYLAAKTDFTVAQLNKMAMEEPDSINRLLAQVQNATLYNVISREFQNAVDQESTWGAVLDEMNKTTEKVHADVMAYQYAKLGSRYTVSQASQAEQNALVVAEQSKKTMMTMTTVGALGLAAFILLR